MILRLGTIGFAAALTAFLLLAALLAVSWRGRLPGGLLILAAVTTASWAAVMMLDPYADWIGPQTIAIAELLRSGAWLLFLAVLLRPANLRILTFTSWTVWGLAATFAIAGMLSPSFALLLDRGNLELVTSLLLAVVLVVFAEQLYRNTFDDTERANTKFLVFGVALMFVYDVYVYSEALLIGGVERYASIGRGYVAALGCPLLAVAARRNASWSVQVYVSRHATFYATTITAIGVYLILMAVVGYGILLYGGEWGALVQLLFAACAGVVLIALVLSPRVRRDLRVLLNKHFYRSRYDYRHEWLRFAEALSAPRDMSELHAAAIQAVADIVHSTRGRLWVENESGDAYETVSSWPQPLKAVQRLAKTSPLAAFLRRTKWIVDLDQYRAAPDVYDNVPLLGEWANDDLRLVVPLFLRDELLGLVTLEGDGMPAELNYEDHDLLKTVGRQIATYLKRDDIQRRLVVSQQFEAYHRLAAFMLHDLKNIIAQQKLVLKNAERHKTNPAFVEDALVTIANSVERMNKMLAQFRSGERRAPRSVALRTVIEGSVRRCSRHSPVPQLRLDGAEPVLRCDVDQLSAAFEHLIRNAQQATTRDGKVQIDVTASDGVAQVEIADDGIGMDADFIRTRLFNPFDSTRGSQGMGIGAYQAREAVRALGGRLTVESTPGKGTVFRIDLPAEAAEAARMKGEMA